MSSHGGERVVLRNGALAQALRASIAVPVIFPSVEVEGRRLVDGVVSDPLPVAVACDAAVVRSRPPANVAGAWPNVGG